MDEKTVIVARVLIALSIVLIAIFLYIPIILRLFREYKESKKTLVEIEPSTNVVNKALEVLKTRETYSIEEKADAFITLLLNSYVLVHTMVNTGNKYNDKIQTKHFKNLLEDDVVQKLNSMGREELEWIVFNLIMLYPKNWSTNL